MTRLHLPRAWWLSAALYVTALCYLLFQGGKTSLMLFTILNALGVYLMLGRWSGIGGVQGVRLTEAGDGQSALLTAGMRLQVKLRMQIPGFWPLPYVIVREKLVRTTGGDAQLYEMSFVPDYKRRGEVQFETAPLRRGRYQFQQTDCSTRDIFGLFEHRGSFHQPLYVQVLPRTVPLKDWRLFRRSQRGVFHHTFTSLWARETTQIDGVREYIHGDRLSRIHWNATAKTGQWKSKEFEREALPRVVFVLDRNAQSYPYADQFELAVSAAASLLELTISRGMPIGFVSAGQTERWYGEGRTPVSKDEVFQHLVDVEADGSLPIGQLLCQVAERYESGVHIVVIGSAADEQLSAAMNALESKRMVPSIIHIGHKHLPAEAAAKVRNWQLLCQAKQWEFISVNELDRLPQALGGASA
ncbi:hypothetical protein B1A99_01450 [Cohnella sp. CIP 111063]|jgi:uncharacterized protein (DUF58 family)|uniref:DUF58 domain-containing protein n=1 Tax=unclassified Cohnella TaxID=2636738 RepID=UPI000B8C621C|nr:MULTISPECIES: DUF58 domain-containing protein [unclassified Cohnella]OXS62555.1 hypothetical protein B1A99_01450 [Cohnella sp. CIP 111063]PRX74803.1 uncharacterized protein (DUF58 family) [Cohnella sp. SGD-V74]